jgi:Domain of unknown function (DU1801)
MSVEDQIAAYLSSLPTPKQRDMQALHAMLLRLLPGERLWFLDGRDARGKVVSNPNIGYGSFAKPYADGRTQEFYRIGISGNATGISVYVMTLDDKTHLTRLYAPQLGKAKVTGYCIRFKALSDIDLDVLEDALRDGAAQG